MTNFSSYLQDNEYPFFFFFKSMFALIFFMVTTAAKEKSCMVNLKLLTDFYKH